MEYSDPILPVCPPKEGHSPQPKDKQSFVWISHLTISSLLYYIWVYFVLEGKRTFLAIYAWGPQKLNLSVVS